MVIAHSWKSQMITYWIVIYNKVCVSGKLGQVVAWYGDSDIVLQCKLTASVTTLVHQVCHTVSEPGMLNCLKFAVRWRYIRHDTMAEHKAHYIFSTSCLLHSQCNSNRSITQPIHPVIIIPQVWYNVSTSGLFTGYITLSWYQVCYTLCTPGLLHCVHTRSVALSVQQILYNIL